MQQATKDMGIDDESSHPELCSEVADGVTRNIVSLFREPDAGNLPVRFDEREQETELRQTGLRRVCESTPTATGRLKPLRLFSTLLQALRDRCNFFASDGGFELFKVTKKYDGGVGREQHHFPSAEELPA